MQVFLIRHSEAVPLGDQGISTDEERPLTDAGLAQAKTIGAALKSQGVAFDRVLTSPLVRARQTAEALLPAWEPAPALEFWPELAPELKPRRLVKLLKEHDWKRVALVGHEPDLGMLAAWLIGSRRVQIEMAKGGVALINCPDGPGKGGGSLKWLLTPRWLQDKVEAKA